MQKCTSQHNSLFIVYQRSITTLARSKIDSSKSYYFLKSVILHTVFLDIGYIMAKAQGPNVNNCLDTSLNKAVNLAG